MNTLPTVSIILPIFNVEEYLEECLLSVLNQTYQHYELIAINDGATDSSVDILAQFEERFGERLIIIHQENGGLSNARNTGLEVAQGEIIYLLDSDDWILPETIELCAREFQKENTELVIFDAFAFNSDDSDVSAYNRYYERNLPKSVYTSGIELLEDSLKNNNFNVQCCCYMYSSEAFDNYRFIEGKLHEDIFFTTQLFANSKRTVVLTNKFFQRRVRVGSITTSAKSMKHADGFYSSASQLMSGFTTEQQNSKAFRQFQSSIVFAGIEVEKSLYSNKISLERKMALHKQFNDVMTFKDKINLFTPSLYNALKNFLKK